MEHWKVVNVRQWHTKASFVVVGHSAKSLKKISKAVQVLAAASLTSL